MFNKTTCCSFALLALALSACSDSDSNNGDVADFITPVKSLTMERSASKAGDSEVKSFVLNQYDLNFDLLRASADQIEQKNAMISTFSLQTAFAMAWAGAQSTTYSDIKNALNFDGSTHAVLNKLDVLIRSKNKEAIQNTDYQVDAVEVNTSNHIYLAPREDWSSAWLDELAYNYGAGIESTDFEADPEGIRKYINSVVSQDTHDRIKDLLPENSIKSNTMAVLTNAIYFKSPWRDEVSQSDVPLAFHKLDQSTVDVTQLNISKQYKYVAQNHYQAVSMPLRDNDFNVMFILPDEGSFEKVQSTLDSKEMDEIFTKVTTKAIIDLKFPEFTFDTSLELSEPLKKLGMNAPLSMTDADFSKMTTEKNAFYIDKVFQKTFIDLNKRGVEAAAATAIVVDENGAVMDPPPRIEMTLDRPFFFVIYETSSRTPLFLGRVMDPSQK